MESGEKLCREGVMIVQQITTKQMSNEKNTWLCRVRRGCNPTQVYRYRDYVINHEIRIPI